MLRCVYADLDAVLLGAGGSFLHDADGRFTLLGARALEACTRADVEVVAWSEREPDAVAPAAALLGLRAFVAADVLELDGEREGVDGLAAAVERHGQARARTREQAIAVGDARELVGVVGALWLPAAAAERDPLLRLEDRFRISEADAGPALYEAVLTTLAESRGRSSSA